MLRSINALKGYTIAASDGDIGHVATFYFDDEHWTVRHLVVDTGGWLGGRKVLISPIAIVRADWLGRRPSIELTNTVGQGDELDRRLALNLTKDQIEHSPSFDANKPVSRQYEADFYHYYGWPYYWGGLYTWGGGMYPYELAGAPLAGQSTVAVQEHGNPHLRSSDEVIGYHIEATDDALGHVKDFIIDDETWQIRYMVVDTSNWWFGNELLTAPSWIDRVSWADRKVYLTVAKETVKGSPPWDSNVPLTRAYEESLYDYYGQPAYWR